MIADSIERLVMSYRQTNCISGALADFLYRRGPRMCGRGPGPVIPGGTDQLQGAIDAAVALDHSSLCIQGPPGCGKTFTAARMETALLEGGKRVGIMSNGHRAIDLLLGQSVVVALDKRVRFTAAKVGDDPESRLDSTAYCRNAGDLFKLDTLPNLVGGKAWVFSHPDAVGKFDHLFIDEVGQVSLANLVGIAASAANLILLGDQMQLEQPTQGTHPGESGQSILEYLLKDQATIPDTLGIFLNRTWRMRPEICRFISESRYEGRLLPEPVTFSRELRLAGGESNLIRANAGVTYVPVEHEDN